MHKKEQNGKQLNFAEPILLFTCSNRTEAFNSDFSRNNSKEIENSTHVKALLTTNRYFMAAEMQLDHIYELVFPAFIDSKTSSIVSNRI